VPNIFTRQGGPVKGTPIDAIDREPISGRARNEFEAALYAKVKRSHQLVLRILLDHAGGRADCWPSNGRIAEIAGFTARNVQHVLRSLEAADLIRCVVDRSLRTQRRVVILDHPNAFRVLSRLGVSLIDLGVKAEPLELARSAHPGMKNPVQPGVKNPIGAGVKAGAPELFNASNIEVSNSRKFASQGRPRPRTCWPTAVNFNPPAPPPEPDPDPLETARVLATLKARFVRTLSPPGSPLAGPPQAAWHPPGVMGRPEPPHTPRANQGP